MKKLIITLVILPVLLILAPIGTSAQPWTGYLYGSFQIEDSNPGTYDVYITLTYNGNSTGWVSWGQTTTVGSPVNYSYVTVSGFLVPTPIPVNYYGIAVIAYKNSNPNDWQYNSSATSSTLLGPYLMGFDPNTDPIVVKWP